MNFNEFSGQIQTWCLRLAALLKVPKAAPLQSKVLLRETSFEFQNSLPQLQIAPEKLCQIDEQEQQQQQKLTVTFAQTQRERQHYQDLFEAAPNGYLVTNLNGMIQEANRAAASLLCVSQKFLVGKPLDIFLAQTARQVFLKQLAQIYLTTSPQQWEVQLIPDSGKPVEAVLKVAIAGDRQGVPVALQICLHDVTQYKRTEVALHQLNAQLELQVQQQTAQLQQTLQFEALLRCITNKLRDGLDSSQILQTAVQELAVVLNVAGCNAAWYNLEAGTSTICYEYVTSIPTSMGRALQMAEFPEIYHQLLAGQSFQFCSLLPHPLRGRVVMLACPICDERMVLGDLWLIARADYAFNESEIRLVQQVAATCTIALRQAQLYKAAQIQVAQLQQLNQLKDDFLSTVSHELRTPIANMKVAIGLLQTAPAPERQQRYLQILQVECEREAELIGTLLDLQQLEATAYLISPEIISLEQWLPKIVSPFQLRTQQRQQQLTIRMPLIPLQELYSDRAGLGRVLAELLNNAHKYTPNSGEIVLQVEQNIEAASVNRSWQTTPKPETVVTTFIVGNAAEIPAANLPHIFEKFYRVPNTDQWRQGGTGLGLALVQKLVQQLGGTISVDSSSGWTTFTVVLPNCQNSTKV